jgi:phytoene dehydrogenase-like protein
MIYDAVVVGAGPNGLAAAVTIAEAGRSVLVVEASERPGGGATSAELTIPGVVHDVCSAVHPLSATSPFLRSLPLDRHGLEWAFPEIDLAHPLDDGTAVLLSRSLDHTATSLGPDGDAWRGLVEPLITRWRAITDGVLAPLVPPRHPLAMARFALAGARSAEAIGKRFAAGRGDALLAGLAAHSCVRLDHPFTAGLGLVLGVAGHVDGWPVARGGTQAISDALVSYLRSLGGELKTGHRVSALDQLPDARVYLLDLGPQAAVTLLGARASSAIARRTRRFRYGAGVCKVDYALSAPVPWTATEARRAGTLHLGGSMAEIAESEKTVTSGRAATRPFVLVSQPTVCDPTRAPAGVHTLWAYSHVPAASGLDASAAIEQQIERFAPGFRDIVIARSVRTTTDLEASNPNLVGGDIAGGSLDGLQLIARPRLTLQPYRLGDGAYLCSASTPPGAGVHGMCGHHAARAALRHELS